MIRQLPAVVRPVPADIGEARSLADRLSGDPADWLPDPARRRGPDRWSIALAAGPFHRSVACSVGTAWRTGEEELWRRVSWTPEAEPSDLVPLRAMLPSFDGQVGVRSDADGCALVLRGTYEPPGGVIGAAADATALHAVAAITAARFLDGIIRRL
ncbi:MAG TPA: hypothetical protein VML96_12525, partial [Egibacteraceae bacterium]|nr:hypothetical protein [Egibacteraceae bacterium]